MFNNRSAMSGLPTRSRTKGTSFYPGRYDGLTRVRAFSIFYLSSEMDESVWSVSLGRVRQKCSADGNEERRKKR